MPLIRVPTELPEKVYSICDHGVSHETLDSHLKYWASLANKYNDIYQWFENTKVDYTKIGTMSNEFRSMKVGYQFTYAAYLHHDIFFDTLGPTSEPEGYVKELIIRDFGSYEQWAREWRALGLAARSWVFLCYDLVSHRLYNYIGDAQNTWCIWDHSCILAMDVTEHAYYLDFQSARAQYVNQYFNMIDWNAVEKRLLNVKARLELIKNKGSIR